MIKGIIFDADGTLLESMPFWRGLMGIALKKHGIDFDDSIIDDIDYMSAYQACDYVIKLMNLDLTPEKMLADIKETVVDFYFNRVTLKPGIKEFVAKLKEQGIKMTVATGTDTPLVTAGLKRNGILDNFIEVLSCEDVGIRKTEPDIYRIALQHLGTEKEETIIFEDALYCAKTAKADGFRVVAVYDATEKKQDELKEVADFFMTDYDNYEGFMAKFN